MLVLVGFAPASAQTSADTFAVSALGDTVRFWFQIPTTYSSQSPPAMLVWWHSLGGTQSELAATTYDTVADARGWLCASHFGPHDRHWNARQAQEHCRIMLEWIDARYPFSHDSIYMAGSSMGGAAGQVWHNNNCGSYDPYFLAATAGGSQILDCDLRARQYLAVNDTNRSMRMMFGGLPGENDSADFEYHRYSAVFLADTSNSMHYNSLTLPVYNTWGSSKVEWVAYGHPSAEWERLRDLHRALTHGFPSGINGHGYPVMNAVDVCDWLSQFSANRQPNTILVAADEEDDYYWTRPILSRPYEFGRYDAHRAVDKSLLKIRLLNNVNQLVVDTSPFWTSDTLRGDWRNLDQHGETATITLRPILSVAEVVNESSAPVAWNYDELSRSVNIELGEDSLYYVVGVFSATTSRPQTTVPRIPVIESVFPNPFNGSTTLRITSPVVFTTKLEAFDMLGRIAWTQIVSLSPGPNLIRLNVTQLPTGVYIVRLREAGTPPIRIDLVR